MLLHPELLERTDALRERFETAQPFKHVVIDRFLDETFCKELIQQFPSFDPTHAVNERGKTGRKAAIADLCVIQPKVMQFLQLTNLLQSGVRDSSPSQDKHLETVQLTKMSDTSIGHQSSFEVEIPESRKSSNMLNTSI